MGYIAPVSQEEALKNEPVAQVEETVAEEVTATEEVAEAPKKKSTKKSAE